MSSKAFSKRPAEREPTSLVDLLRLRTAQQPAVRAYTFLSDGESQDSIITYAELDAKARAIAAWLSQVAAPGDRALLFYPPGLDFISAFFGCLYAGVIAVPAIPPHRGRQDRTLPRLQAIAASARPAAVLSVTSVLPAFDQVRARA